MAGNHWQCCCGEPTGCLDSCNFEETYNLINFSMNISWEHSLLNNQTQACCFDVMNYGFNALATPIGPIFFQRYGSIPIGGCCYVATFELNLLGNFFINWDYDVQGILNCNGDENHQFDVDVPCEYRIFCNGTKWIHELHICHFQVACSGTYTEGDCEGCIQNPNDPCCLVDNHGYRCAGAVARWETPLADLTGAPAVSNLTWCLGGSEYCQPYEVGYADAFDAYNNFLTSNGGRQAWGIYLTDECSEQDPFLPCDPAYNMTAAGQILFGSAPYSFDGSWCSGFLEDYDIGCARWYRDFDIIHGTFV